MNIILNGNAINNIEDFYKQLELALKTGECPWGSNLDALDEVVGMQFNYTDSQSLNIDEIIWLNANKSREALGINETSRWLKTKLENSTSSEYTERIKNWLIDVEQGKAKTLFEQLIEILARNPLIELKLL
jgi:RNAse (barnase) inhibitor barstar